MTDPKEAFPQLPFREKWNVGVLLGIAAYGAACVVMLLTLPNTLWDPQVRELTIVIGLLGLWRFGWWFTHAVRALIYKHVAYARLRRIADRAWAAGGRPRRVHFMMTTFKEKPEITRAVVGSIVRELRETGLAGTLWLGSGHADDEAIVEDFLRREAADVDMDLVVARQDKPGKRYAIGMALRAMRRAGLHRDDIVVFLDGDAVIGEGLIQRSVSLFMIDRDLQAMTTDEEVIVHGPRWMQIWLTMRFAQRRIAMQSHALAGKVLTLTGRLSIFRVQHVTRTEFIDLLEEDHLEHWLWGRFRFLSGDDKSTWYYMLRQNARMLYLPDAISYTIEHVEGTGYDRMVQNLRRWSGNMLRNGARAIALGPRRVGFFIWWCIVDQRLAMWTMLVSPVIAVTTSILVSPSYLATYIVWIALSRLLLSIVLFTYSPRVHLTYPLILYVNQLLNASVKVYCLFRLSKQRWTNRGDQKAGFDGGFADVARNWIASYLTTVACGVLLLAVVSYGQLARLPTSYTVAHVLRTFGQ